MKLVGHVLDLHVRPSEPSESVCKVYCVCFTAEALSDISRYQIKAGGDTAAVCLTSNDAKC